MVSVLWVFLPLISSPHLAAAQLNPPNSQPPQASVRKPPLSAKLSEFRRGPEAKDIEWRSDLTNESANVLRSLRNLVIQRDGASANGTQSPVEPSRCAHIVVFEAPDVDSKMILGVPREFASNMPTFAGLQPCCGDFHSDVAFPQVPPFEGFGRIGTLAPTARIQLNEHRSLFLPETPLRGRDKTFFPFFERFTRPKWDPS
jgi:hypothetical protein